MCTCEETGVLRCPDHAPPPGSWAAVAMIMASLPPDPDEPPMDWDAWKDEMKEADC